MVNKEKYIVIADGGGKEKHYFVDAECQVDAIYAVCGTIGAKEKPQEQEIYASNISAAFKRITGHELRYFATIKNEYYPRNRFTGVVS